MDLFRAGGHLPSSATGSEDDPTAREFWQGQSQRFVDLAEEWLREAQEAGRTSRSLDPPTAARIFVWGGMWEIS